MNASLILIYALLVPALLADKGRKNKLLFHLGKIKRFQDIHFECLI